MIAVIRHSGSVTTAMGTTKEAEAFEVELLVHPKIVHFTASYRYWLRKSRDDEGPSALLGDSRPSTAASAAVVTAYTMHKPSFQRAASSLNGV